MRRQSTEAFIGRDLIYLAMAGAFIYYCLTVLPNVGRSDSWAEEPATEVRNNEPVRELDDISSSLVSLRSN